MRGQTSLPALGLALLALTAVTVLGVAVADDAVVSADRSALDRQAAVALSDRLVDRHGPLTTRPNVLNATAVAELNATTLRTAYGVDADTDVEVALDGETLATTGTVDDGEHVERLVVVEQRQRRTLTPAFAGGTTVTLPRRTDRIELRVQPPANTTVSTVRADEQVVLHDDSGLDGRYAVSVSRHRTVTLDFDTTGPLDQGHVTVVYYPTETRKATLEVTVDG